MNMRSSYGSQSAGPVSVEGDPFAAAGGFALLFNIAGLYFFPGVAVCVLGFIALTAYMSYRAQQTAKNQDGADAGNMVLIWAWGAALVGGPVVGAFHWLQWAHVAYGVLSVLGVAIVVWQQRGAFTDFWNWLFPLTGIAMVAAVAMLGSPPGAEDMAEEENWTPIVVTAVDEEGNPVEGANVYVDLVNFWEDDPELVDSDREYSTTSTTDRDGVSRLVLREDPRFKRVVIRLRCEPRADPTYQPMTLGAYNGYDDARVQTSLPHPKAPYPFRIVMTPKAHPQTALLAVQLQVPETSSINGGRYIKVALSTDGYLPWPQEGEVYLTDRGADSDRVRNAYFIGRFGLVFPLSYELSGRPLTLHVLEPSGRGYKELQRLSIDSVALGKERFVAAPMLPAGWAGSTANVAETVDGAIER